MPAECTFSSIVTLWTKVCCHSCTITKQSEKDAWARHHVLQNTENCSLQLLKYLYVNSILCNPPQCHWSFVVLTLMYHYVHYDEVNLPLCIAFSYLRFCTDLQFISCLLCVLPPSIPLLLGNDSFQGVTVYKIFVASLPCHVVRITCALSIQGLWSNLHTHLLHSGLFVPRDSLG